MGSVLYAWHRFLVLSSIAFWVGTLFATSSSFVLALCCLPHPVAIAWLLVMVASLALPLDCPPPYLVKALIDFSTKNALAYHSVKVHVEDPKALRSGRPTGYEPHSALPIAMPMVFCEHSPLLPEALRSVKCLATSACFYCPIIRHLWWWLGARPATAATMHALLKAGHSALVCPGGVRECTHMEKGRETILLRGRTGFVRIAMQRGAPLVPVFVFGQSAAYSWVKLGPPFLPQWLAQRIAKAIGFLPLLMYGVWGTPLPHPVRIQMVIGKPIEVPQKDSPSREEVQQYLDKFICGMEALFEHHKTAAGYGTLRLLTL